MRYTQKQIEKYQRQKYISYIEKIKKNLYLSFKNRSIDAKTIQKKFKELMSGFEKIEKIRLDTEYIRESQGYIDRVNRVILDDSFDDDRLDEIRDKEVAELNRLQKMRNRAKYRKSKYISKTLNDGWE